MAQSEILGLFTTPEQYQQMRQMQQQQMAADYAGRSPQQQVRYGAYSAGQRFGGGLAGALGAQDPQLKIIAQRQALSKQIDPADPESIMKAANIAAQSGDQQFAMTLAEYARKAQSEMALATQRSKEGRAAATPKELQVAAARAQLQDQIAQMEAMDASPGRDRALAVAKNTLAGLAPAGEKVPEKIAVANEIDRLTKIVQNLESFGPEAEPQIRPFKARLSFLQGAEKMPSFGAEREAKARSEFGKSFNDLTQTQQKEVEKLVDVSKEKTATAGAAKLIMPGQKTLVDIPKFRRDVQQTIDPQIKTVTAADQALQAINDSLATNNFASFRAGQTQFARAISGSGDLSQKELKAAGADPSILGGSADYLSSLFTGTPTEDSQKKIRATLLAIKKVATAKANAELMQQRKLATRSGYTPEDIDAALNFPEFNVAAPSVKKEPVTRTLKSGKVVTVEE